MQQKEFTNYVVAKFIAKLTKFNGLFIEKPGGIIDIEFKSKSGNLELWITTQDIEITIGLTGTEQLNDWHTHFTSYDDEFIDDDINSAIELVEQIINDKIEINYSPVSGYTIADPDNQHTQSSTETLEIRTWSRW